MASPPDPSDNGPGAWIVDCPACGVRVEATGIGDGVRAGSKGAACEGCETGTATGGAVGGTDWGNSVLVDGEVMSPTRGPQRYHRTHHRRCQFL